MGWFGKTKHLAATLAKYDWVLSLDADEALDIELQQSLRDLAFESEHTVYQVLFKNLLGEKQLRWGEWGGDKHIRLFNRNLVNWNDAVVHEALIIPASVTIKN